MDISSGRRTAVHRCRAIDLDQRERATLPNSSPLVHPSSHSGLHRTSFLPPAALAPTHRHDGTGPTPRTHEALKWQRRQAPNTSARARAAAGKMRLAGPAPVKVVERVLPHAFATLLVMVIDIPILVLVLGPAVGEGRRQALLRDAEEVRFLQRVDAEVLGVLDHV